jgi:hypothetical protein
MFKFFNRWKKSISLFPLRLLLISGGRVPGKFSMLFHEPIKMCVEIRNVRYSDIPKISVYWFIGMSFSVIPIYRISYIVGICRYAISNLYTMHMAKLSIFVLLKCKVKTVMSTVFTLHLSKTKIDDFAICMVYKFDNIGIIFPVYRYWKILIQNIPSCDGLTDCLCMS